MTGNEDPTLADEMARLPRSSRTYKIITIGMGMIFLAAMLGIVVWQYRQGYELEKPVRNFADYLHQQHITTATPIEVARDTAPPASKIYKIDVDGQTLWLCYFNPDDPKQREALGDIQRSGTLTVNGQEMPAKVRGVVVLAGYDGSRKKAEILRAFADYETR